MKKKMKKAGNQQTVGLNVLLNQITDHCYHCYHCYHWKITTNEKMCTTGELVLGLATAT